LEKKKGHKESALFSIIFITIAQTKEEGTPIGHHREWRKWRKEEG